MGRTEPGRSSLEGPGRLPICGGSSGRLHLPGRGPAPPRSVQRPGLPEGKHCEGNGNFPN